MKIVRRPDGKIRKIILSSVDFTFHDDSYNGLCVACGEIREGDTEPDARNYHCEACGKNRVFGFQELLINGCLTFEEDLENAEKDNI